MIKDIIKPFYFLLFVLLFTSCKNFQEIGISSVDNFQVKELNQDGIKAHVNVKIKNPNSIGFNIYRSKCDVYYGDIYLGKARLSKKTRIDANSNKEYTFELEGKFKDMSILQLGSLLSGKSQNLKLNGYLKAGKFFYKKKFPIDKTQKLSFSK